jgi:hypothetical protein
MLTELAPELVNSESNMNLSLKDLPYLKHIVRIDNVFFIIKNFFKKNKNNFFLKLNRLIQKDS